MSVFDVFLRSSESQSEDTESSSIFGVFSQYQTQQRTFNQAFSRDESKALCFLASYAINTIYSSDGSVSSAMNTIWTKASISFAIRRLEDQIVDLESRWLPDLFAPSLTPHKIRHMSKVLVLQHLRSIRDSLVP